MKKKKRKNDNSRFPLLKVFCKRDFLFVSINFLFLLTLLCVNKFLLKDNTSFFSMLDIGTFTAVVLAFIINIISNFLMDLISKQFEDNEKLTNDFDTLSKQYTINATQLDYKNTNTGDKNINARIGRNHTGCNPLASDKNGDTYRIPVSQVIPLHGKTVIFHDDPEKMYCYPPVIEEMKNELYKAHLHSKTYNQLMIRCDGVKETDTTVDFYFSRTTYFQSLITNRAIDYKVNGVSVRDILAYGPVLPSLESSMLSNHIGYNGFVETADGKIIFIFRNKHVSIAKNTLQSSVGASLKVKYALDSNGTVTKPGIAFAISKEIEDELCLTQLKNYENRKSEIFKDISFDNVLYFYRELVEGGKPQLVFYAKLPLLASEIKQAYTTGVRRYMKKDMFCTTDGTRMLQVDKSDLKSVYITPDGITIKGKFYKSVPTSAATLALFITYLKEMKLL